VAARPGLEHMRRIAGRVQTDGGPRAGDHGGSRPRRRRAIGMSIMVTAALAAVCLSVVAHRSPDRSLHPIALQSAGTVLWSDGMEDGTLDGWGGALLRGGGEFNSGAGASAASRDVAHTGSWSVRMTLPDGSGGTRLFRWQEPRQYRDLVFSAWFYIPRNYTLTGAPSSRFWNLFQFKSRSTSDSVDPMFELMVDNPSPDRMRLNLDWSPRTLEGPSPGESGWRRFTQAATDIPVGRWFQLTAQLRQSSAFDGALRIWQDAQLLFDLAGIRTSYQNCAYNAWCGSNEWSINNYSDALSPAPAVVYADDASIALPSTPGAVAPTAVRPLSRLTVQRRQRGTSVRGSLRIARAGSRFAAVLRSADGRRVAGRTRARRVRAGVLRFRVALTREQRLRLRRRQSLSLRLAVTVRPPGGTPASAERRVDLRS
jgi:hypothetical protein